MSKLSDFTYDAYVYTYDVIVGKMGIVLYSTFCVKIDQNQMLSHDRQLTDRKCIATLSRRACLLTVLSVKYYRGRYTSR